MEKDLRQLIAELDAIEADNENDPFIQAVDDSFGKGPVARTLGFSPTGELYKAIYKAIKAVMPDSPEEEIKAKATAAAQAAEQG